MRSRLATASAAGERLDEPERAGQEGAFGAGQAVAPRRIAVEQRRSGVEVAGDGVDGAADPWGVGRVELQLRQDQQGGVGVGRPVAARVGALWPGRSRRRSMSSRSAARSALHRSRAPCRGAMVCGDAQGAVQGEPGHQLGVHVVGGVGADLPDAGVGLRAIGLATVSAKPAMVRHVSEYRRCPASAEQPGGVEDPAVAVELVLVGRGVADPHRRAAGVTRPVAPAHVRTLGCLPCRVSSTGRRGRSRRVALSSQAMKARASSCLPDAQEGADADAGVAGPGVAVVPVAHPAEHLRQRGRWRGDRRPGG